MLNGKRQVKLQEDGLNLQKRIKERILSETSGLPRGIKAVSH